MKKFWFLLAITWGNIFGIGIIAGLIIKYWLPPPIPPDLESPWALLVILIAAIVMFILNSIFGLTQAKLMSLEKIR